MLLAFFDLKLRKGDTPENETIELFVRLRTILMLSSVSHSLIEEITLLSF